VCTHPKSLTTKEFGIYFWMNNRLVPKMFRPALGTQPASKFSGYHGVFRSIPTQAWSWPLSSI